MLLELKNIQKTYSTKNGVTFRALNNVSLTFESSGLVYIVGASGSGKSTLLNVIGGLDSYDSGDYVLAGKRMNALRNAEVDSLRKICDINRIDALVERSRSGRGAHLWIFFQKPIEASLGGR